MAKASPKLGAIAPWYGGNRMLAEHVGRELAVCEWVGIPFAGGMAEVAFIQARTIVCNDLHRGVINMARFFGSLEGEERDSCYRVLRSRLFHPDTLALAQNELAKPGGDGLLDDYKRAIAFFIVCWMTRSGTAGTDGESTGKLALRWEAGGGDSAKRYQSAVDSIRYWCDEFRRCTFSTLDCFEFLDKCKDRKRHGIYCDPPFPGPGDKYSYRFREGDHRRLATHLAEFKETRVVCRFYDVPFIREIYPESHWRWTHLEGRTQANKEAPEVLIINGPSYATD